MKRNLIDRVMCWNFTHGGVEAARAEGFTEEELCRLEQCVQRRYADELGRRLMVLPIEVRQRIVRNPECEVFIPVFAEEEATLRGYFLLPIQDEREAYLLHVLIIPPVAAEWRIVRRNCSFQLLWWLKGAGPEQALGWINAVLEEFCETRSLQSQWCRPRVNGSMASIRKYVEFRKNLQLAQQCEANLRLASAISWLEARGMDGLVESNVYVVIRGADDDYDPECSTFVFPFRLQGKLHCLILSLECEPFLCWRLFTELERILAVDDWRLLQAWLELATVEAT